MSDAPNTPKPAPSMEPNLNAAAPLGDGAVADENLDPAQLRAMVAALQEALDEQAGRLAAKDAQIEAANDKVLRAFADLDNMRKRTEKEKEETAKYAITKFARDVVTVADNFERAILSVPQEAKIDNAALNALLDGVTLTEREFLNVLDRHGVRRLDPQGETFNPHHHQAVMETHNPDVAPGTVLQVFQRGYLIDDRVLRPAMVTVATGGTKPLKPGPQSKPSADADDAHPDA